MWKLSHLLIATYGPYFGDILYNTYDANLRYSAFKIAGFRVDKCALKMPLGAHGVKLAALFDTRGGFHSHAGTPIAGWFIS
jgi:hypothetical protein